MAKYIMIREERLDELVTAALNRIELSVITANIPGSSELRYVTFRGVNYEVRQLLDAIKDG